MHQNIYFVSNQLAANKEKRKKTSTHVSRASDISKVSIRPWSILNM